MSCTSRRLLARSALALLLVALPFSSIAAVRIEKVAMLGDPAPGAPAGTVFGPFSPWAFDANVTMGPGGRMLFRFDVSGPSIDPTKPFALFTVDENGDLDLLLRSGDVGGPSGATFFTFEHWLYNGVGDIALTARVEGGGSSTARRGVWRWLAGGSLELVVVEDEIEPVSGLGFGPYFRTGIATDGTMVVQSRGSTPGHVEGLFQGTPGSLTPILFEGDVVDGTTIPGILAPRMGDGTDLRFQGTTGGASQRALLAWDPVGGLVIQVEGLEQTPGTPAGVTYDPPFTYLGVNASGDTAFHSRLVGGNAGIPRDEALFTVKNGVVELLVRENDPAPGMPLGVVFQQRDLGGPDAAAFPEEANDYPAAGPPALNDAGDVAFLAGISGTGVTADVDTGIWATDGGSVELRVLEGAELPEHPGVFLDELIVPLLDDQGDVTFLSSLRGAGVTTSNDNGLFRVDPDGVLTTLLREGDTVQTGSGGLKTVRDFRLMDARWADSFEGCCQRAVGGDGYVGLSMRFTDDSYGVFRISTFTPHIPGVGLLGAVLGGTAVLVAGALGMQLRRVDRQ